MWRLDATPRRIAPLNGGAARPGRPAAPNDHGRRLEVAVAGGLDAPTMARAAVAPWLSAWVSEKLLGDALLLVSELVTNSVLHAQLGRDDAICVRVEISDGLVHLEVEDPGDDAVIAARRPDRARGGGFGLDLVETLADRWGSRHDGGTCVWADLAISSTG
jgi:anti-sigma regulatory factor (Ser/Thr protein kinase)